MTTALGFWLAVASAGVLLLVVGTRRPTLAERVEAMRPRTAPTQPPRPSVFKMQALESVRPGIERLGGGVGAVLRHLGLDPEETARRLALAGRAEGLALYLGSKALFVVAGLGALPLLSSAGLLPVAPLWAGLPVALAAFVVPDLAIREAGRKRRLELERGLVEANLDLATRMAGGMSLAEALEECRRQGEGPFFDELAGALRLGTPPSVALDELGRRMGLDEARDLAGAMRAAEQGVPLADSLLAQARSVTERQRLDALAAGQRAEIRMLVVQAGLILPGFFVLVLYPVAVKLLSLAGGQ